MYFSYLSEKMTEIGMCLKLTDAQALANSAEVIQNKDAQKCRKTRNAIKKDDRPLNVISVHHSTGLRKRSSTSADPLRSNRASTLTPEL